MHTYSYTSTHRQTHSHMYMQSHRSFLGHYSYFSSVNVCSMGLHITQSTLAFPMASSSMYFCDCNWVASTSVWIELHVYYGALVTAGMRLYLSLQIHPESEDYLVIFNYEFLEDFRDVSTRCTGPFTKMKYIVMGAWWSIPWVKKCI